MGPVRKLSHSDVYSLSKGAFLEWHGTCTTFKVQVNPICGLPNYCLNLLGCDPDIWKPIRLQGIWGIHLVCADFGIFDQKHWIVQPNLSGEFRNYLVNYSVPTAKWDPSGRNLIFFGLVRQCELAVYGRPKSMDHGLSGKGLSLAEWNGVIGKSWNPLCFSRD